MKTNLKKSILLGGLAIVGSLALSAPASAELKLDAPDVLLQKAQASRVGYLSALRDIDKNIPELRLREEAEQYLKILPKLEEIGAAQARNNMGATVFSGVANRLSDHALRWVRYELDTPEQLLLPHRYADPEASFQLLQEHRDALAEITEMSERRRLADNVQLLQDFATQAGWARTVVAGYANLRSEVALEAMKDVDKIAEADYDFWVNHLSPATGFDAFLRSLHDRVLNYPNPDPVRFHAYSALVSRIRVRADAAGRATPYYINVLLGEVSRDLITAHFYQEVLFTKNDFELLLKNLNRSQLAQFVNMVNDSVFAVSSNYVGHFIEKGRLVVARLTELGMVREAEVLRRRLDSMK